MKHKMMLVDIDGVVCNAEQRFRKYLDLKLKYTDPVAFRKCYLEASKTTEQDEVLEVGTAIVRGILATGKIDLVGFLTAREHEAHAPTHAWLTKNMPFPWVCLWCRPQASSEMPRGSAVDHKRTMLAEIQKRYEVVMALDDELANCQMFNTAGIPAIHVMIPGINCDTSSWVGEKEPS